MGPTIGPSALHDRGRGAALRCAIVLLDRQQNGSPSSQDDYGTTRHAGAPRQRRDPLDDDVPF